jgi:hypothetical protein
MGRITMRGDGGVLRWFDPDTATEIAEATDWDGHNQQSVHTGKHGHHQSLYRTKSGRWVLCAWSQWQGTLPHYEFIPDEAAREWLIVNESDELLAKHFGEVEPERGPGRPEVGKPINIRLGDDLLGQVDAQAARQGDTRADVLRELVAEALAARHAAAKP